MDLRNLNLEDAKTKDTFGGAQIQSGAYTIEIVKVDKATTQNGATSLNFEIKINSQTRWTTLWLTSIDKDSNSIIENEYDSRRLKQLLILLKIDPSTLTEVATDKNWLINIPQLKGYVGAVIEVVPASSTKPNSNNKQYDKLNILSFFITSTFQTLKEYTEGLPAETVTKEVEKLLNKEYTPYKGAGAPQKMDVSQDLEEKNLPF